MKMMQEQTSTAAMKVIKLTELHAAQQSKHHPQIDSIALALHGKKYDEDEAADEDDPTGNDKVKT